MTKNVNDWRLVNLPDGSDSFRNFRKTRRKIRELDAVAAAVNRCEAVIEASSASGSTGLSSARALLPPLVRQEKALQKYLDAAPENDPAHAFAYAKGDVAYLTRLRSSDYLTFTPRAAFGKALLPVAIVLLTAFLANVVGIILQSQSLKNNRQFEVSLERLRESQRMAGSLSVSAFDFHLRAASDESKGASGERALVALGEFRRQLEQIRNMVAGKQDERINAALINAYAPVDDTDKCIREALKNSKSPASPCMNKFSSQPFRELQDSISSALVNFLE